MGRSSRRIGVIAVSVATAALGTTALTLPQAALAGGATRAATARAPITHTAVAGYLWWDDSSLDSYYNYNSTGGSISVTSGSTGEYAATFGGLGSIASSAIVQVTTYGSSSHNCVVGGWSPSGGDLQASVDCFSLTTGAPANAEFDLAVTRPTATPHGTFDYSYVYKTSSTGTLTAYQYNSAHKKNSVKFLGSGKYQVTLGGPRTTGTAGVVKVSAYGNSSGDCELVKWYGSAAGEIVDVDCFTFNHIAHNRQFMVTYAAGNNLMDQSGVVGANAFANGTQAVYQPAVQFDSARGARITVVHYRIGSYEVLAAGSAGGLHTWGGDVQVNAVGTSGAHCYSDGWSQELTPSLDVNCTNRNGVAANSPFTVEWMVP